MPILANMQVILEEQQNGKATQIPLTIEGISETGYMTAHDAGGERFELHPDGNRCKLFSSILSSSTSPEAQSLLQIDMSMKRSGGLISLVIRFDRIFLNAGSP